MKTRKLALAAISVAIMFTSCSKEDVIKNSENSLQNQIGFSAIGSNAQTKATPITSATIADFAAFAFSGQTYFMGGNATAGVKVSKTAAGVWDYNEKAYWPKSDLLDFYAVSPWHDNTDNTIYGWNVSNAEQKITYKAQNEFGADVANSNVDVMYGIATSQAATTNNGTVKFNFKHILSQVLFKAKVQYASMSVDVNNITICNVKDAGEFTFPVSTEDKKAEEVVATTGNNWNTTAGSYSNFQVTPFETTVTVNSTTDAEWLSNTANPIMLIPQTLTKWDVANEATKSIESADAANLSYVKIDCTIKQNGVVLFSGDLYVPFGDSWEPGRCYIYTLIFGGGYDVHGDPVLRPIEFDAEVTEWVDATNDINTSVGGL